MMKKMRALTLLYTVMVAFTLTAVACTEPQGKAGGEGDELLEPRAAHDLIAKNRNVPDFVILDVRTPGEFGDGHIEDAINIDFNSGGFKTELQGLERKKTYFVYCRTGRRSTEAVKIMKELGFYNIVRMKGDIAKWKSAKLPLVR
jgi:rhodanese-related sulfurtransferase